MADHIQVGNIGTVIRLTVKEDGVAVDVSSASSTKQIILGKPDGTSLTKNASFTTDGSDGKVEYTTIDGDLSLPGWWTAQAYVVMTGFTGHSEVVKFFVHPNIG